MSKSFNTRKFMALLVNLAVEHNIYHTLNQQEALNNIKTKLQQSDCYDQNEKIPIWCNIEQILSLIWPFKR